MTRAQVEAIRPELEDLARRQRASADAYYIDNHCLACHAPVTRGTYNRPRRCDNCTKDNR